MLYIFTGFVFASVLRCLTPYLLLLTRGGGSRRTRDQCLLSFGFDVSLCTWEIIQMPSFGDSIAPSSPAVAMNTVFVPLVRLHRSVMITADFGDVFQRTCY